MRLAIFGMVLAGCSGSTGGAGGDVDADADADADVDSDVDCGCIADATYHVCYAAAASSCAVGSDCCLDVSPIPCGTFGNRFSCDAGTCVPEGCDSQAECRTYASALSAPGAQDYDCLDAVCGGMRTCGIGTRTCVTDDDCCLVTSIPCGTWGNEWRCEAGTCAFAGCTGGADCAAYATALGVPDPSSYDCVSPRCGGPDFCADAATCAGGSDCCDPGSTFACGDYGNRFDCDAGRCWAAGCASDAECEAYATSLGAPNPTDYDCH
jgi:hypothetical protein